MENSRRLLDDLALHQILEEEAKHHNRLAEEQQRHEKAIAAIYKAAALRMAHRTQRSDEGDG